MKTWLALAALLAVATAVAAAETVAPSAEAAAELDRCLARATQAYDKLHAYAAVVTLQERVRGKLLPAEKIRSLYVKSPTKLYCRWLPGGAYAGLQTSYVPDRDGAKNLSALPTGFAGLAGVERLALDATIIDKLYPHQHRINDYHLGFTLSQIQTAVAKGKASGKMQVAAAGVDSTSLAGRRLRIFQVGYSDNKADGLPYRRSVLGFDEETGLPLWIESFDFEDRLYASYKLGSFAVDPAWSDDDFTLKKLASGADERK
jgi:hypothetical protein